MKDEKQSIHFLHIGKTGGSAVRYVLNDYLEAPNYSLKLHGYGTSLENIPNGHSVIFFLRDPVARFISGFYSRQRKGQPRYYYEWDPVEKEVFERYSTPNEMAVSLSNDHALAIMAMKSIQHFKPYSKWYVDFDYFNYRSDDVLFIGFQESLDADFMKLKKILNIPQSIDLPTDDVIAHKNPEGINKSIDEAGISALREWYSEDYKFISICEEIISNRKNAR